jgi:Asp-tRNA(Asn)/Glu-tRNA(Gln) amidotransferase A subunit family amidase
VHLPTGGGEAGLPVGVQLVGRPGGDARLLASAAWAERRLA